MADKYLTTLKRLYLSAYNWVIFFAWLRVVYCGVKTLRECGHEKVYDAVQTPVQWAQTVAMLEIIHLLLGLTSSPILTALLLISSRLYVIWGILWSFHEIQTHWLVTPLIISWSITEAIRHSFLGVKEALGSTPHWLSWLRYSSSMILRPTSIICEVGIIYTALPYIKASEKYCIRMPNKWNFSFDYFYASVVILGSYAPGTLHTYSSLLTRKRKTLSN